MEEHSKFITITYIGSTMGTILSYPIYGIMLDHLGWEVRLINRFTIIVTGYNSIKILSS